MRSPTRPYRPSRDGEARQVYIEELHKKIRVLLEKSLRWQRENLLMIRKDGRRDGMGGQEQARVHQGDEAARSGLAAGLGGSDGQPNLAPGASDGAHGAPPPVPQAPTRAGGRNDKEGAGTPKAMNHRVSRRLAPPIPSSAASYEP